MTQVLGGCLMAVGLLIAAVSGLCTLVFGTSINSWDSATTVLVLGVVPFLIGVGLVYAGTRLIRSGRS